MARSKFSRKMQQPPRVLGLKPFGQPFRGGSSIHLLFEEYEALRLCDYQGLSQEQAAEAMKISRPTLTRILDAGRRKVAHSLVEGLSLVIKGGNVYFDEEWFRCEDCQHVFTIETEEAEDCPQCQSSHLNHINERVNGGIMRGGRMHRHGEGYGYGGRPGRGEGHGHGFNDAGYGPAGFCICLHCGEKAEHQRGVPCTESRCPSCGKKMIREGSHHHEAYLARKQEKENKSDTKE